MRKVIAAVALMVPALVAAQSTSDSDTAVDTAIDEITVLGARSLGALRTEVTRAEDVVFAIFNDLNEDDEYDIICKKEARVGSQILKRVCLSRMYRDALAEATVEDNMGIISVGNMPGTSGAKQQKILREKMRALANENPQLLKALKKRLVLAKELEAERAKRYGE